LRELLKSRNKILLRKSKEKEVLKMDLENTRWNNMRLIILREERMKDNKKGKLRMS